MQSPLLLLDCLSSRLVCVSFSLSDCVCQNHWGCLFPIGFVWHLSGYSLSSAPDSDGVSHTWFCGALRVHYQVDIRTLCSVFDL